MDEMQLSLMRDEHKTVDQILQERGKRYGSFSVHAQIAQEIQTAFRIYLPMEWGNLPAVHRQALTVIADKIARVLSGDPMYIDNWKDIQGYAKLVEDFIQSCTPAPKPTAAKSLAGRPAQHIVDCCV